MFLYSFSIVRCAVCTPCFSAVVSAKSGDNSVSQAIKAFVRHILEKRNLTRRWQPMIVEEKEKKSRDRQTYTLETIGIPEVCVFGCRDGEGEGGRGCGRGGGEMVWLQGWRWGGGEGVWKGWWGDGG